MTYDGCMVSECESLIRKMLVVDPTRRYTVDQVKRHRWMLEEAPRLLPSGPSEPEPNEQILRLMHSLGIDPNKTRDVGYQLELLAFFIYLKSYACIFYYNPNILFSSFCV